MGFYQAPNLVENEVIPLKGLFSQENFFFGYDNVRKLNANENNDNLSCVSNLIFLLYFYAFGSIHITVNT